HTRSKRDWSSDVCSSDLDTPLGLTALIGMLMLIGVVVTNAIVLIDLINQFRERGADLRTAIVQGARLRYRPILMTAAATIFALKIGRASCREGVKVGAGR